MKKSVIAAITIGLLFVVAFVLTVVFLIVGGEKKEPVTPLGTAPVVTIPVTPSTTPTPVVTTDPVTPSPAVTSAPVARSEAGFLYAVRKKDFFDPNTDSQLVDAGDEVCVRLDRGETALEVTMWIVRNNRPEITIENAGYFVGASIGGLCPRHLDKVPS